MRRRRGAVLTSGTSLERIAAESLTRPFSDSVHGDMWQWRGATPLREVILRHSYLGFMRPIVNAADDHRILPESTSYRCRFLTESGRRLKGPGIGRGRHGLPGLRGGHE